MHSGVHTVSKMTTTFVEMCVYLDENEDIRLPVFIFIAGWNVLSVYLFQIFVTPRQQKFHKTWDKLEERIVYYAVLRVACTI